MARVVALIPARGGSSAIPRKNIRPIAGRPLIHWTLHACLQTTEIDEVIVSTDDDEIAAVVEQLGDARVRVVRRSAESATATAPSELALLEFAQDESFDTLVFVQATSPLLRPEDLREGLRLLRGGTVDSVLSVTREWRFRWDVAADGTVRPANYDPAARPRRQDWSGELVENGAFYITSRDALLASGCRLSGRIGVVEMEPASHVEIDTPADWSVVAALLAARATTGSVPPSVGRAISLLVLDVDGVLTDGGMYYDADGDALKKFNTRDGMGIAAWQREGGMVALMTGEHHPAVTRRAAKLGIAEVHLGVTDKLACLAALLSRHGLQQSAVAYIGDDINDLAAMQQVGWSACPCDAAPAVRAVASHVLERAGGAGCVREAIDLLLAARSA